MALTDNLTYYWKLDENSGNATDSIGSKTLTNNGTTTYATGKINNGAVFNGTSQWLSIADEAGLRYSSTQAFSISFWFKLDDTTGVQTIISKWDNDATKDQEYVIYMNGTTLEFVVNGDTAKTVKISSLSADTWYHCVATAATNKVLNLYINAGTPATKTSTNGFLTNYSEFRVGQNTGTNYFDGIIDEIGFWNRVLTSDEVSELYNSGNGLQYPFTTTTFLPQMILT